MSTDESLRPNIRLSELRKRLPEGWNVVPLLRMPIKIALFGAILVGFGLAMYHIDAWWIKLLLSPLMGLFVFGYVIMGHDAGHRTASRNKFLNDLMGTLTMSLVGIPARGWQIKHNLHHKHTGDPYGDTDANMLLSTYLALPRWRRWFVKFMSRTQIFMWWISLGRIYAKEWKFAFHILANKQQYAPIWWWNLSDLIVSALFFVACAWFIAALGFWSFFWVILLPLIWGGWWSAAIIIPQHRGMPLLDDEQVEQAIRWSWVNSRTVTFPPALRWIEWAINHGNFQIEHHLAVGVPAHKLRSFSEVLQTVAKERGIHMEHVDWLTCMRQIALSMTIWDEKERKAYTVMEADAIANARSAAPASA